MNEKLQKLAALGAGDFAHLNGTLIEHLVGTQTLLRKWYASHELQQAGLFHAAYGTAGFSDILVSLGQRNKISAIIGQKAEAIVYLYCACDRDYFFPQFGEGSSPQYKNRFNGEYSMLSKQELAQFCEFTAANELEIALNSAKFLENHGAGLYTLFNNMRPHLSYYAVYYAKSILSKYS